MAALAPLTTALSLPASASSEDDFDALRRKWCDVLTGGSTIDPSDPDFRAALVRVDNAATGLLAKVDGSGTNVFTDLDLFNDAQMTTTYQRLAQLATAWATPGSRYRDDAGVRDTVLAGLERAHTRIYHAGQSEYGNWWSWEIGSTRALADAMAVLYDHIPADRREAYCATIDHFVPDPYYQFLAPDPRRTLSAGANRVDLCQAVAIRAIVGRDTAKLGRARDGLTDVWQYVTSGDGFYRDGSFVQHTWVAYTGTYGHVLLTGVGKLLSLFAGSPWEVADPSRENLFVAVEASYAPVMHDARMMDFVRGRAISRSNATDHNDGYVAIEGILRLADGVDAATAARWRALCAGWIARDTYSSILTGVSIQRMALVKRLAGITPAAEPDGHRMLANMGRAVHRRAGWAFAISMSSQRTSYYEAGNGENDKGFHTGSGMTYLYDRDNGQYTNGFWPTVDLYRLPGTTVDKLPLPNKAGGEWGEARPKSAVWAGGATIDGYAAVGQELEAPESPMRAKKSWFCLDWGVVALGAGITGTSGHPVESVVENRRTNATLTVTDSYAHVDGIAGYLLLGNETLSSKQEARTGSWRDIHATGPTTPITRDYTTLWFDHGVDPVDASYAYAIIPGATAADTAARAADPGFQILANTSAVQALKVPEAGISLHNFFAAGRAGVIEVDGPCSVVVCHQGNQLTIGVADPTHLATELRITVHQPGIQTYAGAAKNVLIGQQTSFTVDVAAATGATRVVTLHH